MLANKLEEALQPLRSAAGTLLTLQERFNEIRARAAEATGQAPASWAWAADDVALLRRGASMAALRTERRQSAAVAG